MTQLSLGLLFDGSEYGDRWEKAAVEVQGGSTYVLQALGETSANWSGSGSLVNERPAIHENLGGAGVWSISNPFAVAVSGYDLFPPSSIPCGNESDFSLIDFRTAEQTPDGGSTLVLLGLASLAGLAVTRRR